MNDKSRLFPQAGQPGGICACTGIVAALLLACASLAVADTKPMSLEKLFAQANELAAKPETRDQAVALYEILVETHLENQRLFDDSLRRLARSYGETGLVEKGIRFFISVARRLYDEEKPNVLQEIFNELKLKYPEQVQRVIAADHSQGESTAVNVKPSLDLANAILQREDELLREKGLERLQEALMPGTSNQEKRQSLATLRSVLTVKFDRKPFRDLVLPLLLSEEAEIRTLALRCLPGLDAVVQDLELVIPMAGDPSPKVRHEVGPVLIQIGQGREEETVIPALMQLMRDREHDVVEWTIRSMWGQYSSPEFDEFLIRLSREPRYHHNVIYHCLSTMKSKSPAVCQRLVEEMDDPDWNNSGRAAWGLTYGVTEEAKALVEKGLLRALPQETNEGTRKNQFRALARVGTEKSRPYLQSVVDSQMETEEFKQLARGLLDRLGATP